MAQLGVMELQEGTDSLVATVQDAGERAHRVRAEARDSILLQLFLRFPGRRRGRWALCS